MVRGVSGVCATALVVIALLTGCGGSSTGGNSTTGGGASGGGAPTEVTFTFGGTAAAVVAAKIGTGSFVAQTISSNTVKLSIPSGTTDFALAFACPAQVFPGSTQTVQSNVEWVIEASTGDGTAFKGTFCYSTASNPQTGTLTGSVDASAISGAASASVIASNGTWASVDHIPASSTFDVSAPPWKYRVQVVAYGADSSSTVLAVKNFDNQAVTGALNNGATVMLDAADQTTTQTIAYTSVPSGFSAPSAHVEYINAENGSFTVAGTTTNSYPVVPSGAMENGDYYRFVAGASNSAGSSVHAFVDAPSPSPMSFALPAPWTYAGPLPAALPTFDLSYVGFSGKGAISEQVDLQWNVGSYSQGELAQNWLSVVRTANYQQGSAVMAVPDLSSVTGFIAPPPSGTGVNWTANIGQGTSGFLQPLSQISTGSSVQNAGIYVVP